MSKTGDQLAIGLLLGLAAPLAGLYIYLRIEFPDAAFADMIRNFASKNILTHVISLSVIINLLLFFIFIRTDRDRSARGVLGATILYAILVVILKFGI